jgi:putative ABC transport system ATP-binding protein
MSIQTSTNSRIEAGPSPDGAGFIRISNLSKTYREGEKTHPVLIDSSVSLKQGEFTAILGKSGSGKTTFLNLVSGIDRPDSGSIWFGGIELSALDDRARTLFRRRNVGFIFQFYNLIHTLTVWENLVLPLELNGLDGPQHAEPAARLLEEVGLGERRKTYPDRLSGGEQQRVAIARALVHNPLLVLADEPTGNLDEDTGRQVMALLDRLTRQAGKNLIMVTHSSETARLADRTFHIRAGHLEEDRP